MRNPLKKIQKMHNIFRENGVCGIDSIFVFFDMIYCRRRFHCTYEEYFFYSFQNQKNRIRKNYLLRYHQRFSYTLVDGACENSIATKSGQYKLFGDMIKREWIAVTPENIFELETFIKKHGRVIFKPVQGSQGKGIFSFSADEIEGKLFEKFSEIAAQMYVCEQYVAQHPKMSELNPNSVNTIRIITLCDGENVKLISAGLRTGSGAGVCDNMSAGGVGAAVDMETGVVFTTGVDFSRNRYYNHPVSGAQIIGFEIPFWNETKEMAKICAMRVPKTAVVGWDIAVTEAGPCLIEANNRPASRLVQIATGEPQGGEIISYIDNNWHKYFKKMPRSAKILRKKFG